MEKNFKEYMIETYVDNLDIKSRLRLDVEKLLSEECQYPLKIKVEFRSGIFCPTKSLWTEGYGHDGVTLIYPKVKGFSEEDANEWFKRNGFTKSERDTSWQLLY